MGLVSRQLMETTVGLLHAVEASAQSLHGSGNREADLPGPRVVGIFVITVRSIIVTPEHLCPFEKGRKVLRVTEDSSGRLNQTKSASDLRQRTRETYRNTSRTSAEALLAQDRGLGI